MIPRRALAALALLLAACGDAAVTPTDGGAGTADLGPTDDLPVTPDYVPAGYTLVPFLSDRATTHTFDTFDPTDPAQSVLVKGRDYAAVLDVAPVTSGGNTARIVLDLLEKDTPITVNSFVFLALHHYFDGLAFHRVIPRFVAQAGDPNTLDPDTSQWGYGGPGYNYGVEIVDGLNFDSVGVVGMAHAQPLDSNGSQFFITLTPQPGLDGNFTVFGRVTEGLGVLPTIVQGQPPDNPTRMTRVYIVAR